MKILTVVGAHFRATSFVLRVIDCRSMGMEGAANGL